MCKGLVSLVNFVCVSDVGLWDIVCQERFEFGPIGMRVVSYACGFVCVRMVVLGGK